VAADAHGRHIGGLDALHVAPRNPDAAGAPCLTGQRSPAEGKQGCSGWEKWSWCDPWLERTAAAGRLPTCRMRLDPTLRIGRRRLRIGIVQIDQLIEIGNGPTAPLATQRGGALVFGRIGKATADCALG
jgi:hypothetical protein